MKWCCIGFQGNFQMAGERGFAVFVSMREGPLPTFILQHRSLDPGASVPHTASPMTLIDSMHIQFCPWCGVQLKDWYRNSLTELDRSELKVPL
jgi:hypothetical protein